METITDFFSTWWGKLSAAFGTVAGLSVITLIAQIPVIGSALAKFLEIVFGLLYAVVLALQGLAGSPGGRKVLLIGLAGLACLWVRWHYINQGFAQGVSVGHSQGVTDGRKKCPAADEPAPTRRCSTVRPKRG
jgi:hypothetical protein